MGVAAEPVQVTAEPAQAKGDLPCGMTCGIYFRDLLHKGLIDKDMSAWCTIPSKVNFCGSGQCNQTCNQLKEESLITGFDNVDCERVCEGATGEEQKVEVAAEPAQVTAGPAQVAAEPAQVAAELAQTKDSSVGATLII